MTTATCLLLCSLAAPAADRPNVLVVITDDQGYGDLGCHGNPRIKTPTLDRFASQSVRLKSFYVSPVCAPTRASLMTGRYNYRTRAVDTAYGRAMMDPDEVTLAEMLSGGGYRTGIFGKWHLGDNYPMRPQDQGFHEVLVHKGGGIGQPADPPNNHYQDPTLDHNGKWEKRKGYCSDIFTDAAIDFVSAKSDKPFFAYLAFNCPHTPLEVPDGYLAPYQKMDLGADQFPRVGHPLPARLPLEETAKVYAMVTNIDDNLARLFKKLDELKLVDNTIVVFMTDNGPQQPRWNAGMLMRKGNVHDGGIHVPGYVRWPARLKAGHVVDRICAHIDLTPTILEACGVAAPKEVKFDGKSLLPLLEGKKVDWPDRTLFTQWHRGDVPELNRACAARSRKYKIVQPEGSGFGAGPKNPVFKLYDMEADPLEEKDIAEKHPEIVRKMRGEYEAWFKDVSSTRGYDPPRIHLGTEHENPSTLTRQDWRGAGGWRPEDCGYWEVLFGRAGEYEVTLRFDPVKEATTVHLKVGDTMVKQDVKAGADRATFTGLKYAEGSARLEPWVQRDDKRIGVQYVDVKRIK